MIVTIEMTCSACPVQFEGTLTNGKWFYFRARGGWSLGVGDSLEDAVNGLDFEHYEDWNGDEYSGYMSTEDALACIQKALVLYLQGL